MNKLLPFLFLTLTAAAELPSWAGAGFEYQSASPHWSGWGAMAVPVSQTAQVYSFSLQQAIPIKGKVPTLSTTTGLAPIVRSFPTKAHGTLYVVGIGTAGVATTITSVTGAFAGGGGGLFKFPSGFTLEVFAIQNKAGGNAKPNVLAGGGWMW